MLAVGLNCLVWCGFVQLASSGYILALRPRALTNHVQAAGDHSSFLTQLNTACILAPHAHLHDAGMHQPCLLPLTGGCSS
jgi:hypothetical protein